MMICSCIYLQVWISCIIIVSTDKLWAGIKTPEGTHLSISGHRESKKEKKWKRKKMEKEQKTEKDKG